MLLLSPWHWFDNDTGGSWGPPAGCRGSIDLASYAQIVDARPGQPRGWGLFLCDTIPDGLTDSGGLVLTSEDPRDARPDGKLLDAWESILGWRPAGDSIAANLWDHLTAGSDPANEDRTGMLVPGVDGRLQLWLGGLLREEPFVFGVHPHTAKLKDLLQRQLNAVRDNALSGKLIDPVTKLPDPDYHLRIADAIVEKYAGFDPTRKAELFAELKPASWTADEEPQAHATTITESFNKADSGTLGPDLIWTEENSATYAVVSNTCEYTVASLTRWARADSDLSTTDQYAQGVTVEGGAGGAGRDFGVMCRKDDTTTKSYYSGVVRLSASVGAFKVVTGTVTQIGSNAAITFSTSATLRLACSGSTIAVDYDGVNRITQTDSTIATGLRCGLSGAYSTSGVTTKPRLDSFEAGDLTAAGTYPRLERGVRGLNRGICTGTNF